MFSRQALSLYSDERLGWASIEHYDHYVSRM
jgi:hypothetical protein